MGRAALTELQAKPLARTNRTNFSVSSNHALESSNITASFSIEAVSNKISQVLSDSADRMTGGSEKASSAFTAELIDATAKFNEASARTAVRIEEAVAAISEKVVGETGEISKQIARAAVDAGEDSRMKVASAGLELAQTFSDMGDQLVAGLSRLQESPNGTVLKLSEIEPQR